MANRSHTINKAVFELYLPSLEDGLAKQSEASRFFKEKIIPLLEKILDELNPDDETIRIDKLEFDFKDLMFSSDNTDSLFKFKETVKERISNLINSGNMNRMDPPKKISEARSEEELFIFLLREGHLPWWANAIESIKLQALSERVLGNPGITLRSQLISLLQLDAPSKRIAFNLSQVSIIKILSLVAKTPEPLIKCLEILSDCSRVAETGNSETVRKHLTLLILRIIPVNESVVNFVHKVLTDTGELAAFGVSLRTAFIKKNEIQPLQELRFVLQQAARSIHDNPNLKNVQQLLGILIAEDITDTIPTVEQKEKPEVLSESEIRSSSNDLTDNTGENAAISQFNNKNKTKRAEPISVVENFLEEAALQFDSTFFEDRSDSYYVKNAGLIILTPYLAMFFKALGLSDGKQFNSLSDAERAVYLLSYLAGENSFEEHEMVLNKLLCGVDLSASLTLNFEITDKEKQECKDLLNAVSANWTALKGTSGEGMRDTFIKRDGLLKPQTNGWDLKIEKTTVDILLEKLPWSISIIKMPWNETLLFVDWT